jgi:hypothetical protein
LETQRINHSEFTGANLQPRQRKPGNLKILHFREKAPDSHLAKPQQEAQSKVSNKGLFGIGSPEAKTKFLEKVVNWNILGLSFLIYSFGDIVSLFMNTAENKRHNSQNASILFWHNIANIICNVSVYWSAVWGIRKLAKGFAAKFVADSLTGEKASKAVNVISDFFALLGALPFNDILKPSLVSWLTAYLIKHPIDWLQELFGLQSPNTQIARAEQL